MPDPQPAIRLRSVSKRFAGRRRSMAVFSALDLDIARSELVTVTGPNGCGKSTLLRLIAGLLLPDAGSVGVRDGDGAVVDPSRRAGTCAAVFEGGRGLYWSLTVEENLRYQAALNGMAPGPAVVAMRPWLAHFGLADKGDELVRNLSKGTQQKLAIVAALGIERPVLLLDEPSTLLDEDACMRLAELLRARSADGQTIVLATHDRAFAGACRGVALAITADGRVRRED